jgi:hypothetical protein
MSLALLLAFAAGLIASRFGFFAGLTNWALLKLSRGNVKRTRLLTP